MKIVGAFCKQEIYRFCHINYIEIKFYLHKQNSHFLRLCDLFDANIISRLNIAFKNIILDYPL